jgi:hypothetical protein
MAAFTVEAVIWEVSMATVVPSTLAVSTTALEAGADVSSQMALGIGVRHTPMK